MLVWLSVWSKVQLICICSSCCHCHLIISCFIKMQSGLKSRLIWPFWCQLTQVVLEKWLLNLEDSKVSKQCTCNTTNRTSFFCLDSRHWWCNFMVSCRWFVLHNDFACTAVGTSQGSWSSHKTRPWHSAHFINFWPEGGSKWRQIVCISLGYGVAALDTCFFCYLLWHQQQTVIHFNIHCFINNLVIVQETKALCRLLSSR